MSVMPTKDVTMDWYVFLMPDGTYLALPYYSAVEEWEADAKDCWIVSASDAESAIERFHCGERKEYLP